METEMYESARALAVALRTAGNGNGNDARELRQRAEGELLRKLVAALQPMLHESMRSHRIWLAFDANGAVELKSDGLFVHVDAADQEDLLVPLQVLQAEPSLLTLLDRIEAELVAASDVRATSAAEIVRLARYSIRVAGAS